MSIGRSRQAARYWKHASEGHGFYTTPEDHYGCTVGSFTHNVTLPDDKKSELESVVGTMVSLEYLSGDDVTAMPPRPEPMQIAALRAAGGRDLRARRRRVSRKCASADAVVGGRAVGGDFGGGDGSILGRPACAMIPHASNTGGAVASFGCIGNRVYTGLADDEFYVTVPGRGSRPRSNASRSFSTPTPS